MLLTQVCSIWRAIALTSPRIWARLHITLPGNPTVSSDFGTLSGGALAQRHRVFLKVIELRCRAVKDWLTRSGTCPLSISIHCPLGYYLEPEIIDDSDSGNLREVHDVTEPLFRLIASSSPRWKAIDLSMPFYICKKLESQVSQDILPLLQSFKARVDWDRTVIQDTGYLPTRFLEAPNLQQLSLNSPLPKEKTAMFPLIWGRLTDLHIQTTLFEVDFFNIIQLCHNLVTCQINDIEPWERQEFHTEVIVPKLEMMKIETRGVLHVLRAINAPCLKSLKYKFNPTSITLMDPS